MSFSLIMMSPQEYSAFYNKGVWFFLVVNSCKAKIKKCTPTGPPMMQDIGRRDLRIAFAD